MPEQFACGPFGIDSAHASCCVAGHAGKRRTHIASPRLYGNSVCEPTVLPGWTTDRRALYRFHEKSQSGRSGPKELGEMRDKEKI